MNFTKSQPFDDEFCRLVVEYELAHNSYPSLEELAQHTTRGNVPCIVRSIKSGFHQSLFLSRKYDEWFKEYVRGAVRDVTFYSTWRDYERDLGSRRAFDEEEFKFLKELHGRIQRNV